jgi:hypothetical protein
MRRRPTFLGLAILLLTSSVSGGEAAGAGELCIAPLWTCTATSSAAQATVEASGEARAYVWRVAEPRATVLGRLDANQTAVRLDLEAPALRFTLGGEKKRGWPAPVEAELRDGSSSWRWRIGAADVARPHVVYAPAGNYELKLGAKRHLVLVHPRVTLQRREAAVLGTLTFLPATEISGYVFDAKERTAIRGAVVGNMDGKRLAVTDRDGRFRFESDENVLRAIVVTAEGFAERGVGIDRGGSDIELDPIPLDHGRSLALNVDRSAVEEITNVTVELFRRLDGPPNRAKAIRLRSETLPHDASGIRFDHLAPGVYVVVLKGKGGLQQVARFVQVEEARETLETIRIDARRVRIAVLHGRQPMPEAKLLFDDKANLRVSRILTAEATTNAEGIVDQEIWLDGTPTINVTHRSLSSAFFYRPRSASGIWTIEIPHQSVLVKTYDADTGAALEGATVIHAYHADDGERVSGFPNRVAADGTVRLTGLHHGLHTLTVSAPGYSPSAPRELTLRDVKEEQTIAIALSRQKGIRVTVVDSNGIPQPDALVLDGFVQLGTNPRSFVQTDAKGEFVLDTAPNERRHLAVIPNSGSLLMTTVVADERGGGETKLVIPRPAGALRVTAVSKEGEPVLIRYVLRYNGTFIPPAAVESKELQQRMVFVSETIPYLVDRLPAGKYEIWPWHTPRDLEAIQRGGVSPAATVQLVGGELEIRLTIEPQKG